jgi:hypothetical protein
MVEKRSRIDSKSITGNLTRTRNPGKASCSNACDWATLPLSKNRKSKRSFPKLVSQSLLHRVAAARWQSRASARPTVESAVATRRNALSR